MQGAVPGEDTTVLVIVPTYNEIENLGPMIQRLRIAVPAVDILIVDDNSPDGTGDLADSIAATDDAVHVLHRPGKQGLGAAYVAGFRWALDRDYGAIVEIDADGSHQPEQLPRLLDRLPGVDVVIGARWVDGGSVVDWPKRREALSRAANLYIRVALGTSVHDATAGFRVYRAAVLRAIDLDSVESQGYCFQVDLTRRADRSGFRIAEVPIEFKERERGESKMSGDIVREAFVKVTEWGAADRIAQLRRGAAGLSARIRKRVRG